MFIRFLNLEVKNNYMIQKLIPIIMILILSCSLDEGVRMNGSLSDLYCE